MTISDIFSGWSASAHNCYNSWFNPEEKVAEAQEDQPAEECKKEDETVSKESNVAPVQAQEEAVKSPVAGEVVWPPGTAPNLQPVEESAPASDNAPVEKAAEAEASEEAKAPAEESVLMLPTLITVRSHLEYANEQLMQDLEVAKIYLGKAKEVAGKIEDEADQKEALTLIAAFEITVADFEASLAKPPAEEEKEAVETTAEAQAPKESEDKELAQEASKDV